MRDYFGAKADSNGISGDDVNRRNREARLGHAEPSKDWEQCKAVVHCIFKGQVPTKTLHDVVLYNFLPTTVLGFVVSEDLPLTEFQKDAIHALQAWEKACSRCGDIFALAEIADDTGLCLYCDPAGHYEADPDEPLVCETCGAPETGTQFCEDCPTPEDEDDEGFGDCPGCAHVTECPGFCEDPPIVDDGPPELPEAGDDQAFDLIRHDLNHLACLKQGLENKWADVSARCTFNGFRDGDDCCSLRLGAPCAFDGCKRVGN